MDLTPDTLGPGVLFFIGEIYGKKISNDWRTNKLIKREKATIQKQKKYYKKLDIINL